VGAAIPKKVMVLCQPWLCSNVGNTIERRSKNRQETKGQHWAGLG